MNETYNVNMISIEPVLMMVIVFLLLLGALLSYSSVIPTSSQRSAWARDAIFPVFAFFMVSSGLYVLSLGFSLYAASGDINALLVMLAFNVFLAPAEVGLFLLFERLVQKVKAPYEQ